MSSKSQRNKLAGRPEKQQKEVERKP